MEHFITFLHLVFIAFLTLFPPVNPVGTSFILDPMLSNLNRKERIAAAKKIAFYCFVICVTSVIIGSWILKLFGISIPIVQIAGGLTICNMGWNLLNSDNETTDNIASDKIVQPEDKFAKIENALFYPMSFPMMCGAGTISVLLTLSASTSFQNIEQYLLNTTALIIGITAMMIVVYICIANTHILLEKIGERGKQVVNKLSAFVIFCIGLQIFWEGLKTLLSIK